MFGRKSKSSEQHNGVSDDLYEFLEEADKLYIKAFETRSVSVMKDFFTRKCCKEIGNWIVAEASSRYFSDERFRTTTWIPISITSTQAILHKKVVYKDIRLNLTKTMKVSEDYVEEWTVQVSPDEFWVEHVEFAE